MSEWLWGELTFWGGLFNRHVRVLGYGGLRNCITFIPSEVGFVEYLSSQVLKILRCECFSTNIFSHRADR